ncbi:hypothetical protein QJS10_CPB18g00863 [Acorus calamus]|uniref:TRAM domain-containing protein n=1 Tax=Acorus calamus TaxID=4465 RepID=A0AAV9CMY3_ACOCL|nr:hypothetical protein QJS10_CPB18g00863 [Acorus calamus]
MAIALFHSFGLRRLHSRQHLFIRASSSAAAIENPENAPQSPTTAAAAAPPSFFPKRGQTVELVCESLAFKGKGLCRVAETGFVVMCDRALPGERFLGRVTRRKGSYAEGTWDLILKHGSDFFLKDVVVRAYRRDLVQVRFSNDDPEFATVMKSIVPCDIHFHYRNKMEFSFCTKKWLPRDSVVGVQDLDETGYALGLHAPGFFDKVLHIGSCLLQNEAANRVLAVVQDCWRDPQLGLSPYDVHSHAGFLKHLMLRTGRDIETGLPELMVNFVTSSYEPKLLKHLVEKVSAIPEVVSVINNVNSSVGNTSVGEVEYILYARLVLTPPLRWRRDLHLMVIQMVQPPFTRKEVQSIIIGSIDLSAGRNSGTRSSIQIREIGDSVSSPHRPLRRVERYVYPQVEFNDEGEGEGGGGVETQGVEAEVLYKLIEDFSGLKGDGSEIILDLFCGTGTIGLTLARRVKHVYGYEVVPQAISDACRNAELNGIHNATFIQGDLNKIGDDFGNNFPKPDIVISDPNRPGMHTKLIKFLLKLRSPRIVYVSCNPATCARDLDYLCHGMGWVEENARDAKNEGENEQ